LGPIVGGWIGSKLLGSMRGGSSNKHISYKHKKKTGWYFNSSYNDEN